MHATAVLEKKSALLPQAFPANRLDDVSVHEYYEKYRHREDGFKYELVEGRVEKTHKMMNNAQAHIAENLTFFFYLLKVAGKIQGTFQTEKDTPLKRKTLRIPDMCYMNAQQLAEAARGANPVPEFMIEVVSPTDKAEKYAEKRRDYFAAGVKVLWLIYPKAQEVHVWFDATHSVACTGDALCSAAPVLPEFVMAAKDIFALPDMP